MHHRLAGMGGQHLADGPGVAGVADEEPAVTHGIGVACAEVVQDQGFMPGQGQGLGRMGADKAGAADNEYFHVPRCLPC